MTYKYASTLIKQLVIYKLYKMYVLSMGFLIYRKVKT
jgi:hypothetical protein